MGGVQSRSCTSLTLLFDCAKEYQDVESIRLLFVNGLKQLWLGNETYIDEIKYHITHVLRKIESYNRIDEDILCACGITIFLFQDLIEQKGKEEAEIFFSRIIENGSIVVSELNYMINVFNAYKEKLSSNKDLYEIRKEAIDLVNETINKERSKKCGDPRTLGIVPTNFEVGDQCAEAVSAENFNVKVRDDNFVPSFPLSY